MHMHAHNHRPTTAHEARRIASERVTLIGAIINAVLAVGKIVFGWLGNSAALVADGIHSFSDLVSDAMVWYAARAANKEADDDHPYGHARIETLATGALGVLLIGVGIGLAIDAGQRIFNPGELKIPGYLALGVAGLSILAKELLYHYTMHVAKRENSRLLRANAWHHRSDAVSSIVVFVGIAGTLYGVAYLDAIAAIAVAVMIGGIGWELASQASQELIDTGLEPETIERMRALIVSIEGVDSLHMLRTRRMGHEALADVHILVRDPHFSVSEGHQISETVRARLIDEIDELTDVTVHIDPEDDEAAPTCADLPLRNQVEDDLRDRWRDLPLGDAVDSLCLHYLSGGIELDVNLRPGACTDLDALRAQAEDLRRAAGTLSYVRLVNVRFE